MHADETRDGAEMHSLFRHNMTALPTDFSSLPSLYESGVAVVVIRMFGRQRETQTS